MYFAVVLLLTGIIKFERGNDMEFKQKDFDNAKVKPQRHLGKGVLLGVIAPVLTVYFLKKRFGRDGRESE